jgi:Zn-finger nucleic acid-binding protein
MMCPVCQKAMIVVEHHQIELDYCTSCQGVWFDSDELELLLESAKLESQNLTIKNILSLPEVKPSPKRRKCPICHRHMKETAIGQPSINIDVCRRGDGLWFDGGELHELLSQMVSQPSAGAGADRQIFDFLGEVFKAPE